jgi:lipid A 4'-phosphatase
MKRSDTGCATSTCVEEWRHGKIEPFQGAPGAGNWILRSADSVTGQGQASAGHKTRADTAFGRWADPVLLLALVALWIALAIVFNGEPAIDQQVSAAFFRAETCARGAAATVCGVFPAAHSLFWGALRNLFHYLPMAAAIVVAAVLASQLAAGRGLSWPRTRYAVLALAAFVLGPGLLVNGMLKDHWGRPRPVSTELYGGTLPFVPAGQWSDACPANCSFVSGEAASIFWLVCLIPLLPVAFRRIGAVTIVVAAVFTSGLRVAFGGHYLSDVTLGGLSTLIIFAALATLTEWLRRARL